MLRNLFRMMTMPMLVSLLTIVPAKSQELQKQYEGNEEQSDQSYDRVRIDRYLNVEIWTDHDDDEYYTGDRVKFYYRVSRDAFVVIYSIDSKGRVNLLFPSEKGRDNYVTGGMTQSLPGRSDDYDLEVSGPEGVENVQIIASREPIPVPDWYANSGLFCDWEDRHDYMDWVNGQYFVKYDGQRFAYDRTSLYIYDWEPTYFRPVYHPYYPSWTSCGNVYVDYWPGSSIYVDGIFWGITPCYIPRIYVGWHTFTVYDHYNYCWEYDVHVTRYNTVVLDNTIIVTQPSVRSKYKTVRFEGYQEPTKAGYADYNSKLKVINSSGAWKTESAGKTVIDSKEVVREKAVYTGTKKFVQGSAKVVKTERGIETAGSPVEPNNEGGKYRNIGSSGQIGKKSTGESGDNTGGSIYKQRDANQPSGNNSGYTPSQGKANLKKGENPARKESSGNSGGETYKKSSGTPAKKIQSSGKSVQGKSDNDSGSKAKKSDPPSQKSNDDSGKKPQGASVKPSVNSNNGSAKPAPAPAKGSGGTKPSGGSGKGKGGNN